MADSTINSSSSSVYNPSASMSVANLTASAMMGAIMAGGDYGFVKDVQEKIHDVTQETRNAQGNLRAAQQKADALQAQVTAANNKKTSENSERKEKAGSKSGSANDAAGLQAQLAAAQQAVSDARQIVKNLQSQLTDLITRALPQAQQKEDTARQQDNQRAQAQRSQGQSSQTEQNLGKELMRTLSDGLEAGKAQMGAKNGKADQLPQSNVVDRSAEFEDVGEGEKNYNDAYLAGTAEQGPGEYAKTKKKDAAAKADDGIEGAPQSSGKPAARSGAAPAGSGLPDAEGLSHADVAKLLRTPTDPKAQQLTKSATASPSVVSSAKAGMQVSSGNQTTSVAPRPTGGGSTSGPQSGSSAAHASASNTRSSKLATPADSGLSLAEAPAFGTKPAISGRGNHTESEMGGNQDRSSGADAHATTTVSLGGVSVAVPRGVAKAASSSAVSAAGQALVGSTRDDPEPMKRFLRSSQPDGRTAEQLASDTLGGFRQMTQALGLGGGNAASASTRGGSPVGAGGAANGGAQNRLGGVMGLTGGDGSSFVATNAQGGSAPQDAGKMDAATTATLAASVSGTQQGGQDAAPAPGANRSARAAGAPPQPANANSPQTQSSAAAGAAQVARVASGSMGVNIGNGGKMRASLSESGAARAVVLGKVTRRAQDEIDPFDVSDVDTGGMDPDDFAQLSPLQRVMALMVSAAGEAEGQAKNAAAALTENADLTQQLGNKKTELAMAIRAAGGLPDEGEPAAEEGTTSGEQANAQATGALLATPVSGDIESNQSAHRKVTRALDGAVTQGSGLLEQLQSATQLVTTFAQGANNVVLGAATGRVVRGKVGS